MTNLHCRREPICSGQIIKCFPYHCEHWTDNTVWSINNYCCIRNANCIGPRALNANVNARYSPKYKFCICRRRKWWTLFPQVKFRQPEFYIFTLEFLMQKISFAWFIRGKKVKMLYSWKLIAVIVFKNVRKMLWSMRVTFHACMFHVTKCVMTLSETYYSIEFLGHGA